MVKTDKMIQIWNNEITKRDVELLNKSVENRNIMEGPVLQEFETRIGNLLDMSYVIGTSSGSAALALALMGIGIRPGDEVIVPDLTFVATANAACMLGAKVILAPTEKDRPLLDLESIDALITEKTKAIITVDLNGRIAWSRELKERYGDKGIYIIDDACQAFMSGDDDGKAGTCADVGCFSFGITKLLTTANGGMVVTNNKELYERMKLMKTQGMKSVFEGDAYYYPGFNFKLPDVLASIGLGQLERLEEKVSHVCQIEEIYRSELRNVKGISFIENRENEIHYMADIICDNRDLVRNILHENGIISRPLGMPLHTAPYLKQERNIYHTSSDLQRKILYLPCGPNQQLKDVGTVVRVLKSNKLV